MSTILNTEGKQRPIASPAKGDGFSCTIITAQWNEEVTGALQRGALYTLREAGVNMDNVKVISVPGTVELVYAAAAEIRAWSPDAVIVLGCVIRGDTPHFDYVCQHTAQGVAELNARGETPVIFGVLTVNTKQQAFDRSGGSLGNKGSEAAAAALEMANLKYDLFGR